MPRRPLFDPALPFPLRLSRRSMELYLECPRCFYDEVRRGLKRPSIPSFTLNKAVDTLLKREFDRYRESQKPHPLFAEAGICAVPYAGPEIDAWRSVMKGIRVFLPKQNTEISGAPDDVLQFPDGKLAIVDFKATAKKADAEGIDLAGMYAQSYKRQIAWYTFLLMKTGFTVADEGYLLVANAITTGRRSLRSSLSFSMHLVHIPFAKSWILPLIEKIYTIASSIDCPRASEGCEYCAFSKARFDE